MGKKDTAAELEKLRAELQKLQQSRSNLETSSPPPTEPPVATPVTATTAGEAAVDEEAPNKLKHQVDELLDLLKSEVGELPTITCLVVFSLGIVMGRFMR